MRDEDREKLRKLVQRHLQLSLIRTKSRKHRNWPDSRIAHVNRFSFQSGTTIEPIGRASDNCDIRSLPRVSLLSLASFRNLG